MGVLGSGKALDIQKSGTERAWHGASRREEPSEIVTWTISRGLVSARAVIFLGLDISSSSTCGPPWNQKEREGEKKEE